MTPIVDSRTLAAASVTAILRNGRRSAPARPAARAIAASCAKAGAEASTERAALDPARGLAGISPSTPLAAAGLPNVGTCSLQDRRAKQAGAAAATVARLAAVRRAGAMACPPPGFISKSERRSAAVIEIDERVTRAAHNEVALDIAEPEGFDQGLSDRFVIQIVLAGEDVGAHNRGVGTCGG